jgi:protoporphyrin/coproporphyrin ferrochelatase
VERGAAAIAAAAGLARDSWRVCYQSRVGRLEWLGPYAEAEIRQAGVDRVPLVVLPVAFVSEHSETLVELDRDYARLAEESGVPAYVRVPALGNNPNFIAGLARLARGAVSRDGLRPCSLTGGRLCPADRHACPAA